MATRGRKRHSPEQIVKKLRDADSMLNSEKDLAAVLQSVIGQINSIAFLDESGFMLRPVRRRTWAPRGQPLPA
jgi:hypothetical protein